MNWGFHNKGSIEGLAFMGWAGGFSQGLDVRRFVALSLV